MKQEVAKEYIELISNLFRTLSELKRDSGELSHMQTHVIEYIPVQNRALNLKEISDGLDIAKQQLINVVSDLEAKGYLIKEPDTKDKRSVLISLTSKGKEILKGKWAIIYEKLSKNLSKLNEEELLDLNYALHKANTLLIKMED